MIALAAFVLGAATATVLWAAMGRQLATAPALQRQNYRGHELPVGAGIIIVLAHVVVAAGYILWSRIGGADADELLRGAAVLGGGSLGFALIGLFDDLVGATATKGFRGHLGALRRRELTTGMVKLVWGVLLGFVVVPSTDLVDCIRGGLIVAAAANTANLFDRAPGRVIKVSLLGAALMALLGAPGWQLTGPMLVIGAGAGLLLPDLRERCMVGDTGANVLGAAVGYGLVVSTGATGQWWALAMLVALNVASELVSFSRVIDRAPPLRILDRLGTLPERRHP
jgi:hypothetical protein